MVYWLLVDWGSKSGDRGSVNDSPLSTLNSELSTLNCELHFSPLLNALWKNRTWKSSELTQYSQLCAPGLTM